MIPTKPVKSRYKYRIISKSCNGRDFTNIDRYRIISSVILTKFTKIISIDICIDFLLSAHSCLYYMRIKDLTHMMFQLASISMRRRMA